MSLTFMEDVFPDSGSDTSITLNKSEKSSRTDTNLPVPKKEPICNQTFVDFSGTELIQFPSEILIKFPYIRVSYLSK